MLPALVVGITLLLAPESFSQRSPCSRRADFGKQEADLGDCSTFYKCTPGGWRRFTCQQNSHFDPRSGACLTGHQCTRNAQFGTGEGAVVYAPPSVRVVRQNRFGFEGGKNVLGTLPQDFLSDEERRIIGAELQSGYVQHTTSRNNFHVSVDTYTIPEDTYSNVPRRVYNVQPAVPSPPGQGEDRRPPGQVFYEQYPPQITYQQRPPLPNRRPEFSQPPGVLRPPYEPQPVPSVISTEPPPPQFISASPTDPPVTTSAPPSKPSKLKPVIYLGSRPPKPSPPKPTDLQIVTKRPPDEEDYSQLPTDCGHRIENFNTDKVFGGVEVDVGYYPWQVGLKVLKTGEHFCGGTIISKKFVVSAAHCFYSINKPRQILVRVGDTSLEVKEKTEKNYRVERIYVHKHYKRVENKRNDIALLKIQGVMEFNEGVQPICLPQFGVDVIPNENCAVSGWGATETSPRGSQVMMATVVPLLPRSECRELYKPHNISIAQFCAGKEGFDTCKGDSGGPLVCKRGKQFMLYGVTSFGIGCGIKNKPGVYTMVAMYRHWIEAKMQLSSWDAKIKQEAIDYPEQDLSDDSAALKRIKELVDYEDTDINEA